VEEVLAGGRTKRFNNSLGVVEPGIGAVGREVLWILELGALFFSDPGRVGLQWSS